MKITPLSMISDLYKLTKIAFQPIKSRPSYIRPFRLKPKEGNLLEQKSGIPRISTAKYLRELKKWVLSHDFRK